MTKEQIRNLIGVVVVSAVVVVAALFFGTRIQKKEAVEQAVQQVTAAVSAAPSASTTAPAPATEAPVPVVRRTADFGGVHLDLSFGKASGTVAFTGIDAAAMDAFLTREAEEIDGLTHRMEGDGTATVSYMGFSDLDDEIVADWLLEDAASLAK